MTRLAAALLALASPQIAIANPVDGKVAAGSAVISSAGSTLTVHQSTDKAVIDWRGFDIGAGETTHFQQPSANSITLNRVNSANPSQIDGNLTANGNIMIVNPNGVVFGAGSRVDVNGLVATTANVGNDEFMSSNGKVVFDQASANPNAKIINRGVITAKEAGLVGLVAPQVENSGVITAKLGRVHLASGDTTTVDLYGDGLMAIAVSDRVSRQLVANSGSISADGGTVSLTAASGRNIVNSLVVNDGTLAAQTIDNHEGVISITNASTGGSLEQRGLIDVSGNPTATAKGGSVALVADNITLTSGSSIHASGATGGGTVKIGGNAHGVGSVAGATRNAQKVTMEQGAIITADATANGKGGEVILWSDDATTFAGNISARGAGAGKGGFVETSGKNTLTVTGAVDLRDVNGNAGTWLLDPTNITIYNRSGSGDQNGTFTAGQIETMSISANVSLTATNNIYIDLAGDNLILTNGRSLTLTASNFDIATISGGTITASGAGAINLIAGQEINLSQNLNLVSGAGAITLQAGRSINYTGQGDITTAGGAITLNADSNANNDGAIIIAGDTRLSSSGGNITLGGGADPTTGYAISTSGHGIFLGDNGAGTLSPIINAGGGNIILNGMGWQNASATSASGLRIKGATISTTGAGNITLNGIGGGTSATTTSNNHGVYLYANTDGTAPSITAQNGTISITGSTAEASTTPSAAILLAQAAIQTTGTGNIVLTVNNALSTMRGLATNSSASLTSGGNITYIGDNLDSGNYQALWNAAGDIIIRPYTAGTTVGIGSGAGTLSITDSWLSKYTYGGTLWLGGYGLTGAETGYWNSSGNMTINTTRSFSKNVNFLSGANILSGAHSAITLTSAASTVLHAIGDILISHDLDITATGTGSVTERAGGNIVYSSAGDITTTGGAIILNSDRDANSSGAIGLSSGTVLTSNGGNVTLGGGANPATGAAYGSATSGNGINFSGVTIYGGGGNILLRGQAFGDGSTYRTGINISGSTMTTTGAGGIDLYGQNGATPSGTSYNIYLDNTTVSTVNGNINLTSLGTNGMRFSTTTLRTTGTGASAGNITIDDSSSSANGIYFCSNGGCPTSTAATIATVDGAITLKSLNIQNSPNNAVVIGDASTTGTISLLANAIAVNSTFALRTTGDVIIRPNTAGTTVGIGSGAGGLNISNTLLSNITYGGTLWLGGYGLTGAEAGYWNSSGAMTINTTRNFTGKVNFLSGNDITVAGNLAWSGSNILALNATRHIVINSGVTISNTYASTFGASVNPTILVLRADSTGANNGGSFTNNGTINFASSTGAVAIYYDRATYGGAYTAGTQTANGSWVAPTNQSIASQVSSYQLVNTVADLAGIGSNLSGSYAIGKNIVGGGAAFNSNTPLGGFSGVLDGGYCGILLGTNCSVTGLTMNPGASYSSVGLFGSNSGKIRNLTFGMDIVQDYTGTVAVGMGTLVGTNNGIIANVVTTGGITYSYVNAPTTGSIYVGGMVGVNGTGTIYNSRSQGATLTLTSLYNGSTAFNIALGGLVGDNTTNGVITNSSSSDNVDYVFKDTNYATATTTNSYYLGGLVGANFANGIITGSNATGWVRANYFSGYGGGRANSYVGGLAGANSNNVANSYATGAVTSNLDNGTHYVGGLLGTSFAGGTNLLVDNSYATGDVSYTGKFSAQVGGLAGQLAATVTISNSYATGNVSNTFTGTTGQTSYLGGLVGQVNGSILTSYARGGTVTGTAQNSGSNGNTMYIGGLVGSLSSTGSIANSYSTKNALFIYQATTSAANTVYVGGLVANNASTVADSIYRSYAQGNVTASYYDASYITYLPTVNMGGLVGRNGSAAITESFAMGSVSTSLNSGSNLLLGGLTGYNAGAVNDTYAMGSVTYTGTSSGLLIGGLIGQNQGSVARGMAMGYISSATGTKAGLVAGGSGTITDSYYDYQTTGQSSGATGARTTSVLQASLQTNWSSTTWGISAGNYPYLKGIFASAPEIISGRVYNSSQTALAGEKVSGFLNGVAMNDVYTSANGYYFYMLPSGTLSASNVLLYLTGSTKAAILLDAISGSQLSQDFTADGLKIQTASSTISSTLTHLASTQGANTGSNFFWTNSSGLTMNSNKSLLVNFSNNLLIDQALSTSGSYVYFTGTANLTQSAALTATSLALAGSTANYTLTNTSNNVGTLAGNAASIDFNNGNNNLSVGTVNGINGITTTGNTTLAAGTGTITTSQAINTGAGSLTLTADDLVIGAALTGTGTLTLQPYSNRIIRVALGSGDFNLNTTEIGYMSDGWGQINIGTLTNNQMLYVASTSWTDPVTFRNAVNMRFYDLIGTGNASFTATTSGASYANLWGNITTAGGAVDFSNMSRISSDSGTVLTINTGGGALNVGNIITSSSTKDLILNSGGGLLTVSSVYNLTGSAAGQTLTLNAGTGTLSFGGTVNTAANITASAGSMSFNGAWGGTTALGDITLTSTSSLSLPAITTAAGKTVSATVTGAGNMLTTGAINTGTGGNITLMADDLTIGAALSGTGTLTLKPYTASRVVCVTSIGSYCTGGYLLLSATETGYFTDGWSGITIGRSDGSGTMEIGATSWTDPVTFLNNFRTQIDGNLTGTGNASFTVNAGSVGWVNFNIPSLVISTAGQNVSISGTGASTSVSMSYDTTINTAGGNVAISFAGMNLASAAAANRTFTVNAGTGTVALPAFANASTSFAPNLNITGSSITLGALGGGNGMGDVTLNSANSLTLPTITTVAGKTVSATVTGAGNSITTSTIATGAGGNITLTADDLAIGGALSGTGAALFQTYSSSRTMNLNTGSSSSGYFYISGAELSYITSGFSSVTFGKSNMSGDVNSGYMNWQNNNVYFVSGSGNIGFSGANTLGTNYSLQATTTSGSIRSNTSGSITASGTGSITLTAGGSLFNGATSALNLTTASGNINLTGSNAIAPTYNTVITSTSGNIIFNNPINLAANLSATTTSGTLTLASTVNGAYNLTLSGATLSLAGAWGGTTPVGDVTLTATNSLTLPAITTAAGKTVSATVTGAGNSITTTGAIATGVAGNITLTADDLILGAALSGTGTLTLQPNSTSRVVCVSYTTGACASNNFGLSATEIGYFTDGWSGINIGKSGGSAISYIGSTTWSDPVLFRGGQKAFYGLTGIDNASFSAAGASNVDIHGNISTVGGNIDFSAPGYVYFTTAANSLMSSGGNISIQKILMNIASRSATIDSGGGNINISGNIYNNANAAGQTLTFYTGTGTLSFGGTVNTAANVTASAGTFSFNGAWGGSTALGTVSLTSTNALSLPSITASSIFARTTGAAGDLTVGSGTVLTASGTGNALTLVAGRNFINGNGASALALTGAGRWLVYSANPTDTTGEESLSQSFNRYSCAFAAVGTCAANATIGATIAIPGTGNGLIYSYTPLLSATPNAVAGITYGDAAPTLTNYGYTLAGYRSGDTGDTVTGSLNGSTSYAPGSDVGAYDISHSSGTLASTLGYGFTYAANASGLNIAAKSITASLTGTTSKVYDGLTSASLTSGNYVLTGLYGSDAVTVATTSGNYNDKNVGTGKTVTVAGLTLAGAKAGNYTISNGASVSAAIGSVTPRALLITANDATRLYTRLNPTFGASYSGLVAGDSAVDIQGLLLSTAASVASPVGDYVITASGATAQNYTISFGNGVLRVLPSDAMPSTVQMVAQNPMVAHVPVDIRFSEALSYQRDQEAPPTTDRDTVNAAAASAVPLYRESYVARPKLLEVDPLLADQLDLDRAAIEF